MKSSKIQLAGWLLQVLLCAGSGVSLCASDFSKHFADSTLRLDYIFAASPDGARAIYMDNLSLQGGWAGRRHNLRELPRRGNGQITVTDPVSADTLYRTSFSTLYHEWLVTPEAQSVPKAFENTFLVPYPKQPVNITVTLTDTQGHPMTEASHRVDPADILIARRPAHPAPHRYLHRSSHPESAIDVAILGEGYTRQAMDSFYVDSQTAVDAILSYEPFKSLADSFNFVAVESPSEDCGISIPKNNDWKNTSFDSHFSTHYSDRYMTSRSVKKIHDALRDIPYEHIIILANTPEYGGGGIYNSYTTTSSRNPQFRPVVAHEFGHSFGGLADEYWYETEQDTTYSTDLEPWEPNITTLVDFGSKWQRLLPQGTQVPTPADSLQPQAIGVYEGAGYQAKGVYRPVDRCLMRVLTEPFCPACQDAIASLISFYTE